MNPKPILTFAINSSEPSGYFYVIPGLTFWYFAICSQSKFMCFGAEIKQRFLRNTALTEGFFVTESSVFNSLKTKRICFI
jgi:hypothetical protein